MKNLKTYLAMLEIAGYAPDDYEVFETADGNLCLQIWESVYKFREVLFTADGKFIKELGEVSAF